MNDFWFVVMIIAVYVFIKNVFLAIYYFIVAIVKLLFAILMMFVWIFKKIFVRNKEE